MRDGSAPYYLTNWTATPSVHSTEFDVEFDTLFTWNYTEPVGLFVSFHGLPPSAHDNAVASPAAENNIFAKGSEVTLKVNSVVEGVDPTDPAKKITYICTGWTGTGDVPASGSGSKVLIRNITHNSTIKWQFVVAHSITTKFKDLPEHLQYDVNFDPLARDTGDVSLLWGSGSGDYQNSFSYKAGGSPRAISVSDIDVDGDADIVVANADSNDVAVLLGNGNGMFEAALYTVGTSPSAVFVADVDGDTYSDIITANAGSNNVTVLLSKGGGAFDPKDSAFAKDYAVGDNPQSVFVADVDGDTFVDIVTANAGSNNISVLLYNDIDNNGTFDPVINYDVGSNPQNVFVSDIDGDTNQDIIVANTATSSGWDPTKPVWLPLGSTQTFTRPTVIFDQGGRVKYEFDPTNSSGTTLNITDDSIVTWAYKKLLRLRIDVDPRPSDVSAVNDADLPRINDPGGEKKADAIPWDTYYLENTSLPLTANSSINGGIHQFMDFKVVSGNEPLNAPLEANNTVLVTILLTDSTEVVWNYIQAKRCVVGRPIAKPTGAVSFDDTQFDTDPSLKNAFHVVGGEVYPGRPISSASLTWKDSNGIDLSQKQNIYSVWPSDASLHSWGDNQSGQLGQGDTALRKIPTRVEADIDWMSASMGSTHTIAVKFDGTLWSWGANDKGQLGLVDNFGSKLGDQTLPTQITEDQDQDGHPDTDWVTVAAGQSYTLVIKKDGSLWSWGANDRGQLGNNSTTDKHEPIQIGSSQDYWFAVAAGASHSLAIKKDGSLWSWGANDRGQLGNNSTTDEHEPIQIGSSQDYWFAVAAGASHSLAIKKDGSLWSWGANDKGQLGQNNTSNPVLSPTQVPTTFNGSTPVYDIDWVCIATGAYHSLAVKSGGTLWAWGDNQNGQLGLGPNAAASVNKPTRVGMDINWLSVFAGGSQSLAKRSAIQKHIVGAPVNLQPSGSQNTFYADDPLKPLFYSEAYGEGMPGPTVDNPVFNPPGAGKSLLRFTDNNGDPVFIVVESVFLEDVQVDDKAVDIGKEIVAPGYHSDPEGKNGYVFFEKAYYDSVGDDGAYDRSTREGQIIPVNETTGATPDRRMVVAWYETGAAGIGWPVKPIEYTCKWPTAPDGTIVIASGNGSDPLQDYEYNGQIYNQPDRDAPGYNPNEEHALLLDNKVYALRNDLNTYQEDPLDDASWKGPLRIEQKSTSKPYVLLKYWDPDTESWQIKVFKVEAGNDDDFKFTITAGEPIIPLMPLEALPKMTESGINLGQDWYHRDHKGGHWAKASNGLTGADQSEIVMHWHYPLQSGFYYPPGFIKIDRSPVGVGDPIPFLNGGTDHTTAPKNVSYVVSWAGKASVLKIGETLTEAKSGLPGIVNWAAGEVIFDEGQHLGLGPLARLFDPYAERSVPMENLPASIRTEPAEGKLRFPDLLFSLRSRLFYDPVDKRLLFKGISYDPGIGEPLLLPNVMTLREKQRLQDFTPYWHSNIADLYNETRDKLFNQKQQQVGVPMALTAGAAAGEGYVVLAENDHDSLDAAPVALHVIRVAEGPYRGEVKVLKPDDVFDEKLTLRHSGDFGGEPEKFHFAWYYKPDNTGLPPRLPNTAIDTGGWVLFDEGMGKVDITIEGASKLTLSDNWFMVHYYYGDQPGAGGVAYPGLMIDSYSEGPLGPKYWSNWAGAPGGETAQLAEGWIKRVVSNLNPLDARVKDFRNYAVNMDVSLISQIGQRYEGDIALSGTPENLNSLGLIEAYETVINRARDFSIDAAPPSDYGPANNAILNGATRIAGFYTALGNEAYADSQDPTIGFDIELRGGDVGQVASSIFAFQNQLDSLLEEELVLLRGRDDSLSTTRARPVYNRLVWNFTNSDGELAYAGTYNIRDKNESGVVDELDAKIMYPQGHGDAWGHYLTAMKVWYKLLKHDHFTWEPRVESVLVGGAPIPVDYLDERKFAETAASKARTGAEIVNLTYRSAYVDDPAGQWQGYKDTDAQRAWGFDGWARRAGQGAYFDWVVANAMLPEKDPVDAHTGIQKIDRGTVPELGSIASEFRHIQAQADQADRGLNPLGLAKGVVPFDINQDYLMAGRWAKTHFEQVYDRAVGALKNARTVFDYANQYSLLLRDNDDNLVDFRRNIADQERDYNNRLIEIFGYPYAGDIGAGGTYKAGYEGPDLFHWMYVDLPDLTGEPLMGQQVAYTYTFDFDDEDEDFDTGPNTMVKDLNHYCPGNNSIISI